MKKFLSSEVSAGYNYLKRIIIVLALIMISLSGFAQLPEGWSVNPASYSFDGEVSAKVVIDGVEVEGNGVLAAFVDGECRGLTEGQDNPVGVYVFTFRVYSNSATGENISFKFLDLGTTEVFDLNETVAFESDMVEGTAFDPLVFTGISLPGNDATLSDLKVDGTTVTGFDAATLIYNVELAYGTTSVPTVTVTTADADASAVITAATSLPGSTTVLVSAEDGTTQQTYTVNFTIAAPATDATLSDLKIDGTTVSGFDAATMTYNVELAYGTTTVPTVTVTTTDSDASAVITAASSLPGSTTVVVTAEDGTTQQTYTVNFTIAPNSDATLSDLKVDGTTIASFDPATLTYAVELPFGTTVVPTVTATTNDSNANAVITPATELPGATTVVVTAEDGTSVKTYTINFSVNSNNDATLRDLKVDGSTIAGFDAATLIYNIELPYGTTTVPTVTATTNDASASLVITAASSLPGSTTVVVTAEDGTTQQTYTVNFTIATPATDATLSDLKIDGTTVSGFDAATLTYNVELSYGTTVVPTVTATANDSNADAVITAATQLPGSTLIVVTAEDGTTLQAYTVNFTIAEPGTDATLSDLKVDGTTIDNFDATTLNYSVELPYGTTTVPTVIATAADSNAEAVITDASQLPGATIVVVTAEDGTTQLTYTVNFTIADPSTDANLSDLQVDGTTVTYFDKGTLIYAVELPYGTTVVPTTTATAHDSNAELVITNATQLPGTTTILVTAEDGITQLTYTINFTIALNDDASLSDLKLDGKTIDNFNSDLLSYIVTLPFGTTAIPSVSAIATDQNATVIITQASQLPGVANVEVTAADGITKVFYEIRFYVLPEHWVVDPSDYAFDGEINAKVIINEIEIRERGLLAALVDGEFRGLTTGLMNPADVYVFTMRVYSNQASGETIQFKYLDLESLEVFNINETVEFSSDMKLADAFSPLTFTGETSSDNADLSDLKLDGTTITGFSPSTLNYEIELPYGTTAVPAVTATLADLKATMVITNASELPGASTVVVTAEDETTIKTYTVTFTILAPGADATLSDLKIDGTSVSQFTPTTLTYEVELAYGTTDIPEVTAITNDPNAVAVITAATQLPGSTTVLVTAEDGTTVKTYTVNFTIAPNNDATLSDLKVDGTTVTNFDAANLTYVVELPYGTTTIPTVTAVSTDSNAEVEITDATELPGSTTVVVTAEDDVSTQTYTINFTLEPNDDASLSDLKVDGTSVSNFDAATLNYTVELAYGTIIVPMVTAIPTDSNAEVVITDATELPGSTTVVVTAEDDVSTQTYTINFTLGPNDDATLIDLQIDGTTLSDFDAAIFTYVVELPYGTTVIPTVTASATDSNASIEITDATELPGSTIVVVTAENGTTQQTYTVNFTIAAPGTDASLSDLKLDGTTISGFSPSTLNYDIELPYGTTTVPTVSASPNDSNASKVITPAVQLPGSSTVLVTAEDGITQKTYSINFTVALNNDETLIDLKVDGVTIDGFNSTTYFYTVTLPYGTTVAPTVTATANDPNASVQVNSATELPGYTFIRVTAEDGTSIRTYRVTFNIETPDATLSGIKIEGTAIANFNPDSLNYVIELASGTTIVPVVTAIASDQQADVIIVQANQLPGSASITVTAVDGVTIRIYTVTFTTSSNTDAALSELQINGNPIVNFDAALLNYDVELPYGTISIPIVTAVASDSNANIEINDATELPGITTITVTAEDGITVLSYSISFTLALPGNNASLSNLLIDGTPIQNFDPAVFDYFVDLEYGTELVPTTTVVTSDTNATAIITPAVEIPGTTQISVTAADGVTTHIYSVEFRIAANENPVITSIEDQMTPEDTPLQIDVEFTDNPDETHEITIESDNESVSFESLDQKTTTHSYMINLEQDFFGEANVTVTVEDNRGGVATETFLLTVTAVNDAPIISNPMGIANKAVNFEDFIIDLTLVFNDVDNEELVYELVSLDPAGVVNAEIINNSNLKVSSIENISGQVAIAVRAIDGDSEMIEDVLTLNVTSQNTPPIVSSPMGVLNKDEDFETFNIDLTTVFTDNDGEDLDFGIENSDGTSISAIIENGQLIVSSIANEFSDGNSVAISATDGFNEIAMDTLTVNVAAVNDAPIISTQIEVSTLEDNPFTVLLEHLTVDDPDNDYPSDFNIILLEGEHYSIDGNIITPETNYHGLLSVGIMVNDGELNSIPFNFELEVESVNDQPIISNIGDQMMDENDHLTLNLEFTDADIDDSHTLQISSDVPDFISISFNEIADQQTESHFEIIPDSGWSGTANISVIITDNSGAENNAGNDEFMLTVQDVNDAPVIITQTVETATQGEAYSSILEFSDPDSDELIFSFVSAPAWLSSMGTQHILTVVDHYVSLTLEGTPDPNASDFLLVVQVSDGEISTSYSYDLEVISVNYPPEAKDSTYQVREDQSKTIVLEGCDNETPDSDLIYAILEQPQNGILALNPGSSNIYTYTPTANYFGDDFFTYSVTDGDANSTNARIDFNVLSANDKPSIEADQEAYATIQDSTITLIFIANDDIDGANAATLEYEIVSDVINGTLVSTGTSGSYFYTPATGFYGNDIVILKATETDLDPNLSSDQISRTISVERKNVAPVAYDRSISVNEDESITFNLLASDDKTDILNLVYEVSTPPSHALNYTIVGNEITYQATENYDESDQIKYRVKDEDGAWSEVATVDIGIQPVNDAPTGRNEVFAAGGATSVLIDFANLVTDVDSEFDQLDLEFTLEGDAEPYNHAGALGGTMTHVEGSVYRFDQGGSGLTYDVVLWRIKEGSAESAFYTAEINGLAGTESSTFKEGSSRVLPVTASYSVIYGKTIQLEFIGLDIAAPAQLLTLSISADPALGTLSNLQSQGLSGIMTRYTATYTPAANETAQDVITFSYTDGTDTESADIKVNIGAADIAPVLTQISAVQATEDAILSINIPYTDLDTDFSDLSWSFSSIPAVSGLEFNVSEESSNPASISVSLPQDYVGSSTIEVKLEDNTNLSDAIDFTLTVNSENDAPVIASINDQTSIEDETFNYVFSASDVDTDLGNLSYSATCMPEEAAASITFVGSQMTFIPASNYNGEVEVTVKVEDNETISLSDDLIFKLNIENQNDAPQLAAISNPDAIDEDAGVIAVQVMPIDIDAMDELLLTVSSSNSLLFPEGSIVVDQLSALTGIERSINLTPALNLFGNSVISVNVSDGEMQAIQQFEVQVNELNDNPVIEAIGLISLEANSSKEVSIVACDVDSPDLTYSIESNKEDVSVELITEGCTHQMLIHSLNDYLGTAQITIEVNDNEGGTAQQSVTVEVTGEDQLPYLLNPIADIEALEDADNITISLADVFDDPDNDNALMNLSIAEMSDANILEATISGTDLTIVLTENAFGTVDISLKATSNGKAVYDVFTVNVASVDDAPELLNAIPDINVDMNEPDHFIDLSNVFTDVDNEDSLITKAVINNTNPDLISANIEGDTLQLTFTANLYGEAEITIEATSNGQTVEYVLRAEVNNNTAIGDLDELEDQLIVYPNPNNGQFYVKYTSTVPEYFTIRIFDLTGKLIYAEEFDHRNEEFIKYFDIGQYGNNIYLFQLRTKSAKSYSRKIIVK